MFLYRRVGARSKAAVNVRALNLPPKALCIHPPNHPPTPRLPSRLPSRLSWEPLEVAWLQRSAPRVRGVSTEGIPKQ